MQEGQQRGERSGGLRGFPGAELLNSLIFAHVWTGFSIEKQNEMVSMQFKSSYISVKYLAVLSRGHVGVHPLHGRSVNQRPEKVGHSVEAQ